MPKKNRRVADQVKISIAPKPAPDARETPGNPLIDQFAVLIFCDSEQQQIELLRQLLQEGRRCRSLIA